MADQYVNGRRALLQMIDGLLAEDRNIKTFRDVFQSKIDPTNPDQTLAFFKDYIMPLMPKDTTVDQNEEEGSEMVTISFVPAKKKEATSA